MMDLLKDIVNEIGGDFTQIASDIEENETYVDTGSFIFNALVSGSIRGGVSGNKITAIAGESSTGKTFFSLAVVKNFLDIWRNVSSCRDCMVFFPVGWCCTPSVIAVT